MGESREQRIEALLSEGLNHYGAGEVAEAVVCWEEVLRLDPEHADALDYLQTARENETQQAESPDAGTPTRVEDAGEPDPASPPYDPDSTLLLASYSDVVPESGSEDPASAAAPEDEVEGLLGFRSRSALLENFRGLPHRSRNSGVGQPQLRAFPHGHHSYCFVTSC